jgi:hypothetical protein
MVKPLSFKDFVAVDYTQDGDDLVNYRAYRRKRLDCDVDYSEDTRTSLDEILSISGRRKKARDARRRKTQLKISRRRARRKMARDPVLKKRSRRSARKEMETKLLKGKKKADMSDAIKASIERRLDNKAFQRRIDLRQKRLMPTKRREEIRRKKGHKS